MVRIKERYILVNIVYPRNANDVSNVPDFVVYRRPTIGDLTPQVLARAIKSEVRVLFGDCGAGVVERTLSVKYLSKATSTFILRVTREQLRYVWSALTFMHHVPVRGGQPCMFRVMRVGGTIRKVEQEAVRQTRALMLATKAHMDGQTASAFDLLNAKEEPVVDLGNDEADGDDDDDNKVNDDDDDDASLDILPGEDDENESENENDNQQG